MNLFVESDAVISPCGTYRYRLSRTWDASLPVVCWIMLNPSTADATEDDPTIRRCMGFARDWQHGGIVVVNLFAYRATDPKELRTALGPVGTANDQHIIEAARSRLVVAAWGNHGALRGRDRGVRRLLRDWGIRLHYLKLSKSGQPVHPLYQPASARPVPWEGERQ